MYHSLAVILAHFLMEKSKEKEKSEKVIIYGTELFISAVVETILVLMIGGLTNHFWETIVFLGFFCPLRKLAGGYHAPNYFLCTTIFSTYYWILCNFAPAGFGDGQIIVLLLSCFIIIWLSPVADPNKPISKEKGRRLHKRVIVVILAELIVLGLEKWLYDNQAVSAFMYYSFITECILLIAGQIKNTLRRRKYYENEQDIEKIVKRSNSNFGNDCY